MRLLVAMNVPEAWLAARLNNECFRAFPLDQKVYRLVSPAVLATTAELCIDGVSASDVRVPLYRVCTPHMGEAMWNGRSLDHSAAS